MKLAPRAVLLLAVLAILATVLGQASEASAQTTEAIAIPATAFVLAGNTSYLQNVAAIEGTGPAVVRAPVQFTKPGLQVCRLSMWAHDADADFNVTVRLVRKRLAVDGTPFGAAPETIASASSFGAVDALRRFSTFVVTDPVVSSTYFFWVELEFVGGAIQVTGVLIQTATTC